MSASAIFFVSATVMIVGVIFTFFYILIVQLKTKFVLYLGSGRANH